MCGGANWKKAALPKLRRKREEKEHLELVECNPCVIQLHSHFTLPEVGELC